MEIKSFAATMGLGLLTGAAVALMLPKQSPVYKAANDTAKSIKHSVAHAVDSMM